MIRCDEHCSLCGAVTLKNCTHEESFGPGRWERFEEHDLVCEGATMSAAVDQNDVDAVLDLQDELSALRVKNGGVA